MGIFDRLFKSKPAAPTTAPEPPAPPGLPAAAKIESYVLADAVGVLRLADGGEVRFGRSACKGFEPVGGASVILEELAPSARGLRAKVVTLDPSDGDYDRLLGARDDQAGLAPRARGEVEAAATATQLALVTVLLKEPLPEGTRALREWAARIGLPQAGIEAHTERDLELSIGGDSVLTYPGRTAFPRDGLDARDLPASFDWGRSFIGLGTGLPGMDRRDRRMAGARDDWAADGRMRRLSRLVRFLAGHGSAVVLHRAGQLVVPADAFIRMLGDLDDPECRPFAAWLDIAVTERGGEKHYATFGMDAFGLPDVCALVDPTDRWSRARAHEAVLFACYRMVRDNRELGAGGTLRVPLRARIGAWPLDLEATDAFVTCAIETDQDLLRLRAEAEASPADQWRSQRGAIALDAYRALLDHGLEGLTPSDLLTDVNARNPDGLPHSVEVRARHDHRGFLIVTNGFGRTPRPGGGAVECPPVEVAAWVPEHSFELVRLVGMLGGEMFASSSGAWKPGDSLTAPIEELGIGGFVVADGGRVEMGGGPTVQLLLLVPLAPQAYAEVRGGSVARWLSANPVDPRSWATFLERRKDRMQS